jgi:hypothetical protein
MRKIYSILIALSLILLTGCEHFNKSQNRIEEKIAKNESAVITLHNRQQDNAAAATKVVTKILEADPVPSQFTKVALQANNYVQLNLGEPTAKTWLEWQVPLNSMLDAARASTKVGFEGKLLVANKDLNLKVSELATNQEKVTKLESTNIDLNQKLKDTQNKIIAKQKEDLEQAARDAEQDGLLRKGLMAVGSLLILVGVAIGYLKKDITVLKWFGGGAALCFGAAWLIGQWWFPWVIGGIIVVAALMLYRKHSLAGDLVGGIGDVRSMFKDKLKNLGYNAHPEYVRAIKELKDESDAKLKEWVTEHDGVAAQVDAIRREKGTS